MNNFLLDFSGLQGGSNNFNDLIAHTLEAASHTSRTVNLRGVNLGPEGGKLFASALVRSSPCLMQMLAIGENNLGDVSALIVARALVRHCPFLRVVNMVANGLSASGVHAVVDAVTASPNSIIQLDLDKNEMDPSTAVRILSSSLSTSATLLHLDLSKNAFSQELATCAALLPRFRSEPCSSLLADLGSKSEPAFARARDSLNRQCHVCRKWVLGGCGGVVRSIQNRRPGFVRFIGTFVCGPDCLNALTSTS
jgi:hypothetical protein